MSRIEAKYITTKKINNNYFNLNRYYDHSYSDRKINNIYFDTLNDNFYRDHIEGSLSRHKVRVRWYESLNKINNSFFPEYFLEIKIKKKNKISKIKTKLKNFDYLKIDLDYINYEYLKLLVKENLKIKFSSLFPKLENSYNRKYYIISKDPNNRLTLDYSLSFSNFYGNNLLTNTKFNVLFNILEHKYIENKIQYILLKIKNYSLTNLFTYKLMTKN